MDATLASISNIESFFYNLLTGANVSSHVFAADLPNTVKDSWTDMVVFDLAGYMRDLDSRCETSVLVMLFAKPFKDGTKNVPKLNTMETALINAVKSSVDSHYFIKLGSRYSDYDSARNLHCNIYSIELLIS